MPQNRFPMVVHFGSLNRTYFSVDSIVTCCDWFLWDSALLAAKKVWFNDNNSQNLGHSCLFCMSQASRCQFTVSWRLCRLYSSGRPWGVPAGLSWRLTAMSSFPSTPPSRTWFRWHCRGLDILKKVLRLLKVNYQLVIRESITSFNDSLA